MTPFQLLVSVCALAVLPVWAADIPANTAEKLAHGEPVDLIVEFAADDIEAAAKARPRKVLQRETAETLKFRVERYQQLKDGVARALQNTRTAKLFEFSHLPLQVRRFNTQKDLQQWASDRRVKAIYEDRQLYPVLTNSLPLIQQPAVAAVAYTGANTTVVVIDNGIDISNAAFGGCTAPGLPASCRVVSNQLAGTATGTADNSHGTNVSAITLGVAPASHIAMQNAFSGSSALTSNVIAGINWAIANAATYNIVAINMSLGDGSNNATQCSSGNPFLTPVNNAISAGITVVAASGNSAFTSGLANPACTPNVVSVGAVYSKSFGGLGWGNGLCTDNTTAADKVACFSNSASYLSLLAPGALITAGGIQQGGTSQASPHVAGAVALLRSAFPAETLATTKARLLTSAVQIIDPRNGITKPRLDLLSALRPLNDNYAARSILSGSTGNSIGTTLLATQESGEVATSVNATGHSVWWRWTAPASGQVSLNTHGSNFDTQLAVYLAAANVGSLSRVASNDDDGSGLGNSGLLFQATAGTEYAMQVDGGNAAQGNVSLNWALNTSANANLKASISGNGSSGAGNADYTFTVNNAGPQTATNTKLLITLPANVSVSSLPAGCTKTSNTITCIMGQLGPANSLALMLTITWLDNAGGVLSASASSDLIDNSPADNGTTIDVLGPGSAADVPTLPQWASLILVLCLLGQLMRAKPARTS